MIWRYAFGCVPWSSCDSLVMPSVLLRPLSELWFTSYAFGSVAPPDRVVIHCYWLRLRPCLRIDSVGYCLVLVLPSTKYVNFRSFTLENLLPLQTFRIMYRKHGTGLLLKQVTWAVFPQVRHKTLRIQKPARAPWFRQNMLAIRLVKYIIWVPVPYDIRCSAFTLLVVRFVCW